MRLHTDNNTVITTVLFLLFSCFAFFIVFISSKWGIGVSPDSANYLLTAKKFKSSLNLHDLPTHWPPLYIFTLAGFNLASADILYTTRILHALLFSINTALFMGIIYKYTKNRVAIILAGSFFPLSPHLYLIHFMAWSESLFMTLLLLSVLVVDVKNKKRLFLSAMLIGFCTITRYAGIAFAGVFSLFYFLCYTRGNIYQRLLHLTPVLFISILPLIVWIILNILVRDESTNRELAFHPINSEFFILYFDLYKDWFGQAIIGNYATALSLIVVGISSYAYIQIWNKKTYPNLHDLVVLCFFYIVGYTIFIITSISFFDAHTPVDHRIFIFINVFLFIIILLNAFGNRWFSKLLFISLITIICINSIQTKTLLHNNIIYGKGYLSRGLNQMELLKLASSTKLNIYTNADKFIELHTGKKAFMLPRKTSTITLKKNDEFQIEVNKIRTELTSKTAIIIYFNSFSWRNYLPNKAELETIFNQTSNNIGNEGSVFY